VAGKDLAIGTAHDMSPAFAMMLPGLFFVSVLQEFYDERYPFRSPGSLFSQYA